MHRRGANITGTVKVGPNIIRYCCIPRMMLTGHGGSVSTVNFI